MKETLSKSTGVNGVQDLVFRLERAIEMQQKVVEALEAAKTVDAGKEFARGYLECLRNVREVVDQVWPG